MTLFLIAAALLTALALGLLLPPLLRPARLPEGRARAATNVELLREQLAELDTDLANGTLSPAQHGEARVELERRVLEESHGEEVLPASGGKRSAAAAVAVALFVPLGAALMYLHTGSPGALDVPQQAAGHSGLSSAEIEGMVATLEARLKERPDDAQGWVLLARSNAFLQRYDRAALAYARATALVTDDAGLYADYADVLAMTQGRRLQGEPERLVERALQIDPDHVKALALAGTVAFEKGDYVTAARRWERILEVAQPDSGIAASIRDSIAEARARAGGVPSSAPAVADVPTASGAGGRSVAGTIRLAPALADKVAPDDTVFVLAQALEGPRMPIAIIRRQVRDLPLAFTLSDEQAMTPQMKLSNFGEVTLTARISKSGTATAQSGDLQGATGAVKVGAADIVIEINSRIP